MTKPDGITVIVPVPLLYVPLAPLEVMTALAVSVAEPMLCPCTYTVPTLVEVTLVKVTELTPKTIVPADEALFETRTVPGAELVTVTFIGTSGAVPRLTLMVPCMLAPTVALLTVIFGAVTVAAML
jgi:hypothetical protein